MDTVKETAYIVEFINDLREEIDSIYDRCIKIGKQEAYKGNQNSVLGGLLQIYVSASVSLPLAPLNPSLICPSALPKS